MPINIFLCDDDLVQLETLTSFIHSIFSKGEIAITQATSGEELLSKIDAVKPDTVILDIEMKGLNGIQTGFILREKFKDLIIVFITGFKDYAFDAFSVKSFDYIIKPVTFSQFKMLMDDIIIRLDQIRAYKEKSQTLVIASRDKSAAIRYDDIFYFEKSLRKVRIYTKCGIYEYYGTFKELMNNLNMDFFVQCHQGYIVNISKIKEIRKDELILNEIKSSIPMSRKYKSNVREAMSCRLFS